MMIGKKIGANLYVHKSAVSELPEESQVLINSAQKQFPAEFGDYQIIKINDLERSVSFIKSPNFDTCQEPIVGDSIKISIGKNVMFRKARSKNPQIYHHKWMMVKDDYEGFNVEKSKQRSEWWEQSGLDFDRKKIGNHDYWMEHVVIPLSKDAQVYSEDVYLKRVDKACVKQVPALFKSKKVEFGSLNLDIGGGRYDLGTMYLQSLGVENRIYDPFNRSLEYNNQSLQAVANRRIDTVTIANVLNVIEFEKDREGVLAQAAAMVALDGVVYIQIYEGDASGVAKTTSIGTIQLNRRTKDYISEISKYFGHVEKIKGESHMLMAMYPLKKKIPQNLLDYQGRQFGLFENVFRVIGQHSLSVYDGDSESPYPSLFDF